MSSTTEPVCAQAQALRDYDAIITAPPEPAFDNIVEQAALSCGAAGAVLAFSDGLREWYKAVAGLDLARTSPAGNLCAAVFSRPGPLVIADGASERDAEVFLLHPPHCCRFLAAVAIRAPDGQAIGALAAVDPRPRAAAEAPLKALSLLAAQTENILALRRAAQPRETDDRVQESASVPEYALLNSANAAIIATDEQGRIVFFNFAAERMLGYRAEDVIGNHTPELFHDPEEIVSRFNLLNSDAIASYLAIAAETRNGVPDERDWTYIRKDGTRFPARVSITPLKNARGIVTGYLKVATDITRLQEAEIRLKRSERFIRAVLNAFSKHFYVLDEDGCVVSENRPWLLANTPFSSPLASSLKTGDNFPAFLASGSAGQDHAVLANGVRAILQKRTDLFIHEYAIDHENAQYWFTATVKPFPEQDLGRAIVIYEDISDHKRMEHRFRQAIESAPNAMVLVNEAGTILLVNAQTEASFGYSRAELLGQSVELLLPARYRNHHPDFRQYYLKDPKSRLMGAGRELFALRKNGSEFPVEIGLSLIENYEERLILSSIVDITERKLLEQRFRQAVESAPNAIVMVNEEGRILLVNAQTEASFGYSREELIGQSVEILVPARFQTGHVRFRKAYFASPQSRPMGAGRELFGRRKDGSEFPVEIGLSLIDDAEETLILSSIVDITERVRLTKRFREAVESAPNAIVMVNEEGRILLVNAQTEASFGYSREELIGQSVEVLVPTRFRSSHNGFRQAYFASPQSRPMGAGRELFGLRKDGSEFPVEIGLSLIDDDEQTIVLSSIVDITERKNASDILKQMLNEKETLLKEVYHRVKNNLQVVSSLISLQAKSVQNDAAVELLHQSADRIKAMALLHEKLYQSKDLARIDFNSYIRSLIDHLMFSYVAQSENISLDLRIEPIVLDLDTAIPCGLIINELVTNSLKHAFPNNRKGKIRIYFRQERSEFSLIIADNGVGMPADFTLNHHPSLGLQLVSILTNQLMGTIRMEHDGSGSAFTINFSAVI